VKTEATLDAGDGGACDPRAGIYRVTCARARAHARGREDSRRGEAHSPATKWHEFSSLATSSSDRSVWHFSERAVNLECALVTDIIEESIDRRENTTCQLRARSIANRAVQARFITQSRLGLSQVAEPRKGRFK